MRRVRVLEFKPDMKDIYNMVVQALISTEKPIKGYAVRELGKIQDKIESLGERPEGKDLPVGFYQLKPEGGIVELEEAQFDFLKDVVTQVTWIPSAARKASLLYDFIDAVPTKEAFDKAKDASVA